MCRAGLGNILQRPVQWILWNSASETALIVISEEAELLIPVLRTSMKPKVHLITYAAPVTRNMLHFADLSYFVLPRFPEGHSAPAWLSREVGIFAGRLYIDFHEYAPLIQYLRLEDKTDTETLCGSQRHIGIPAKNSVDFLLDWLTACRKGQDITHTPMGYICQRRVLRKDHPFFVSRDDFANSASMPLAENGTSDDTDESEDRDQDPEDE